MAEHNSLEVGDQVTHPSWPEGMTRRVVKFSFYQRAVRGENGRTRIVQDETVRFAHLDEPPALPDDDMPDDAWAELGLERVG